MAVKEITRNVVCVGEFFLNSAKKILGKIMFFGPQVKKKDQERDVAAT